MILLLDIGNTNTHLGLANPDRVVRQRDIPTSAWFDGSAAERVRTFAGRARVSAAALCSVVPRVTPTVSRTIGRFWRVSPLELSWRSLRGVGIRYPRPATIGADRLANAVAARHHFGAPVVVVDFGTAVTFDVVDRQGDYVGGVIAPGLAAMTDYLHEKTALLPKIRMREIGEVIGKSTRQAMLIGAVHGYRGLVQEILKELRRELRCRSLPVVATGGYAGLIAARLPEIQAVDDLLTLEGLRLVLEAHQPRRAGPPTPLPALR
jgi:type III pantothenate kinase